MVLGATSGACTVEGVRRLQREWYARLREVGFDDIEYGREGGRLKVACRENRGIDPLTYECTLEYFSRAEEFLDFLCEFDWQNAEELAVWRMHTEGLSLREIAKARGRSLKWAFTTINALKNAQQIWLNERRSASHAGI